MVRWLPIQRTTARCLLRAKRILIAVTGGLCFLWAGQSVWANTTPVTAQCLLRAAWINHVPVLALIGILTVEQGRVGHKTPDSNGTADYGPMQINTIWLPRLWSRFHISRREVEDAGCINVAAGAWILHHDWQRIGFTHSIWQAIARYHSATPQLADPYAWHIYHNLSHGIPIHALLETIDGR